MAFEDVIFKRPYTSTVKCISSHGSVYAIKSEDFEQKLKKYERTWKALTEASYERDIDLLNKIYISIRNRKCDISHHSNKKNEDGLLGGSALSEQLQKLIKQKNLKLTAERIIDFRSTMKEIVNVENHGKIPNDSRQNFKITKRKNPNRI